MAKIVLAGGTTCPNRDGSRGIGGCTFCSAAGGGEFCPEATVPLLDQYLAGVAEAKIKWKDAGYIGYFQSFSNTYAPIERLEKLFFAAAELPEISALRIATRADCVDDEVVALLGRVSEKLPVSVELGLQTIHDETAKRINRCHTYDEFLTGYHRLKAAGIPVCVHLINGLCGEGRPEMVASAKAVGKLCPDGVKIHMLHIIRDTALAKSYAENPFPLLTKEEYVAIVAEQLCYLPKETVIERLTGDGAAATLIAPLWTRAKMSVINDIDKYLYEHDLFQGMLFDQ